MMKHWISKLLIILPILCAVNPVRATTSEYTEFYILYERQQSGYTCLHRQIMQATFGIPLASLMSGIFADSRTLHQQGGGQNTYENINLLHQTAAPITWVLNFDNYHANGVTDYSFTLDFATLSAANGTTTAGRQKTVNTAKLAIISIIKTAELLHGVGKFRVWLRLNNLPSGAGLSGAAVSAGSVNWPGWPYTASSSLYQTYQNEMIHPGC